MFNETDMLCTMEMGVISGNDDDTFAIMMSDGYEYQCADGSYVVPYDYINDGEEDCDDGLMSQHTMKQLARRHRCLLALMEPPAH